MTPLAEVLDWLEQRVPSHERLILRDLRSALTEMGHDRLPGRIDLVHPVHLQLSWLTSRTLLHLTLPFQRIVGQHPQMMGAPAHLVEWWREWA